jgi:putative membrane protein
MYFILALVGAAAASLLSCVPALHIYNVASLLILVAARTPSLISPEAVSALMIGLMAGYSISNSLSSVFFSTPDDSTLFLLLPGQKLLRQRRGWEAILLTGIGGLSGLAVLILLTPVAAALLPGLRDVLQPHLHWILLALTTFILLSEWPKEGDRGATPLRRLAGAWGSLLAGLLTFALSGALGFVLMYGNLLPPERAFVNLMPAFIGLFGIPWLLHNIVSHTPIPTQHIAPSVSADGPTLLRGALTGSAGGLFAAFFPVVTGGVGGLIAGHATAARDERLFLISQGASKVTYYLGGLLLFFVPGLRMTRGGMAWMLSGIYSPLSPASLYRAAAAALLSGVMAFLLLLPLARLIIWLIGRVDYRIVSAAALFLITAVLGFTTGPGGLLVATVATPIGLLPALWGTRRMNCLGVLLLPITLELAGLGGTVARWIGLS